MDKSEAIKKNIATFLRQIRKNQKLTQEQLAVLIDLDRATVSKMEQGKLMISLDKFILMCQSLDLELTAIFKLLNK